MMSINTGTKTRICDVPGCSDYISPTSKKMCKLHLKLIQQRTKVSRLRRREREQEKNEKAEAYPQLVETIEQLTQELKAARAALQQQKK